MGIQVRTTHNVVVEYQAAGIFKRIAAYIIDLATIIILASLISYIGARFFFDSIFDIDNNRSAWVFLVVIIGIIIFYHLLMEYFNYGQSIGKFLLRIRVVRLDGSIPSFSQYLLRWLFRPFDVELSYGALAIIMIAVNKNSQRLGDYLAGTTVIDLQVEKSNRKLSISDLDFKEDYELRFPNLLERLSDRDIQTIRSILSTKHNYSIKQQLLEKIVEVTGYKYNGRNETAENFLQKIIDDYYYLSTRDH